MKFHNRHGKDITLSGDRLVSEATDWIHATCFSDRPIKPGKTLELQVLEDKLDDWIPRLWIGVTTMNPKRWDLSVIPYEHQDTWCLDTRDGEICIKGKDAGYCEEWKRKGCNRRLKTGDTIGLRITGDRTVSISLNDTEVPDVFSVNPGFWGGIKQSLQRTKKNRALPDQDLWLVIEQWVKKLRIASIEHSPLSVEKPYDHDEVAGASAGLNRLTFTEPTRPQEVRLTSTVGFTGSSPCNYWKSCLHFVQSLGIPDTYFNPKHHMCFCQPCMDSRKDDLYYDRGVPAKKYALPVGWARFGLGTPLRAISLDVFSLWHVAFHGTASGNLRNILDTGDLLLPGDHTIDGKELSPPEGHFTEKKKPKGFDIKQVFVSPSIIYAGLPVYARPERWRDTNTNRRYEARVALQLRIKPDSYKVGPETVLPKGEKDHKIDSGFDNKELEWSTKNRGAIIPTGLMVLLIPK